MQDLLEFEQRKGFDRSITIRVCLKQRLNQKEIEKIFESYEISWENTQFLFRKGVEKIQFVYIICKNNNEAKRIYDDRTKIIKKWGIDSL
jgi:hypothetical protein